MDESGKFDDISIEEIVEERTISLPSLNVNVDFNDLMDSKGVQEAFKIIGELKDLLS